jgi:hypothetical protein
MQVHRHLVTPCALSDDITMVLVLPAGNGFGEAEPRSVATVAPLFGAQVGKVNEKRRLGYFVCATFTRATRASMVAWLWPSSMSKSIPTMLAE